MRRFAPTLVAAGLAGGLVAGLGSYAVASSQTRTLSACVTHAGAIRSASPHGACPRGTTKVALSTVGAPGPAGAAGPPGSAGSPGAQGPGSTDFARSWSYATGTGGVTPYNDGHLNVYIVCGASAVNITITSASGAIDHMLTWRVDGSSQADYGQSPQYVQGFGTTTVAVDGLVRSVGGGAALHVDISATRDAGAQTCSAYGQVTP